MMARYAKKPVVIDAWKIDVEEKYFALPCDLRTRPCAGLIEIYDELHDSWIKCQDGDWVIRGVKGEYYPCKPDVFAATYEAVPELEIA